MEGAGAQKGLCWFTYGSPGDKEARYPRKPTARLLPGEVLAWLLWSLHSNHIGLRGRGLNAPDPQTPLFSVLDASVKN